ncbi:hypothetical protein F7230_04940 [Corynebacterium sp. 320]|uniref:Uncharacterized protein n=1 Tax=Corynebacterium zhongnanshanii TaxID=2768834 RepID=A0ABQ6VEK0_9CORY|nr:MULTISPECIES: hypothetical protein [Corynebacterium]KAB1504415.1 hypothetical protein F7230_04940 [Corynebacterium sp. 320]KAB1552486.1 hypothetical protein F7233_01660 [Corynebacterium sp. 321]KAB1554299.1 hypothetical protein F7232_04940 [Corynebacterium sp. 319]KAB3522728.1 hypothetical protein F8377_00655 [Corynebacterium zhongnanshanii]KAB3528551.1 hypothetical protein F8354_04940 [Corynebacterium sp. 250]
MYQGNYRFDDFMWSSTIFVVVPTLICLVVFWLSCGKEVAFRSKLLKGELYAFCVGFMSAACWLSWNSYSTLETFVKYGPPADYPVWQIICCGATVIIGSLFISHFFSQCYPDVLAISLLTGAGFAIAFACGASFGVTAQEGIGIVFSFVGITILCLVVNVTTFSVVLLKRHVKQRKDRYKS